MSELRRITVLFRPHRARLVAVLALIVVSAGTGMVSPFLLRAVLDDAIPQRDAALLSALVGGMIGVALVTGALGVAQTWLSHEVGQGVMHDLRTAVYRHLQRLSLAFFTRTRTGEVQSRLANDIGGVQSVVTSTATSIVSNATTVLATTAAMLVLDWRLAVFTLAVLPLFVGVARRVGAERRRITARRQSHMADMSALVEESLSVSGMLLGRTMGRGDALADRFASESVRLAQLEVRARMAGRWQMAAIQTTFSVMPALVYWIAGAAIAAGSATITLGTLVAFTTLQTRLLFPMLSLLSVGVEVQSSLALFRRIFEYLDLPVDLAEPERPTPLRAVRGEVRFEDVTFTHAGAPRPAVRGVDLAVPAGATVAIVGETGAGKTTLGHLVARLYDPQAGRVTIDGVDVRDVSFADLAETVGVVTQDTYLFHASVRENLRFAKPDATDHELEAAARAAHVHDVIAALPDGYDTLVGERGHRFSGGERQRLALARVLLRDPAVVVLDEATSALDVATERAVQEALVGTAGGRTTIAIAHRLSTVRDADQIVVLHDGTIAERGTHEELLSRAGGRYARLWAEAERLAPALLAA